MTVEREHILTWLMTLGRDKAKISSVYSTFELNTYDFWGNMKMWVENKYIITVGEDTIVNDEVVIQVYYKLSDKAIKSLEE
jgi:hypothetical protein